MKISRWQLAVLVCVTVMTIEPAFALAVKLDGEDVAVQNNDIFALIKVIGGYVVGSIFGAISIYGLFHTLHAVWNTWGEVHEGRKAYKDLLGPIAIGGSLIVMTFAVAAYAITNFTNFFA